ncbi:MAG: PLP-dependent aminotransferase family protein [Alphaproteobacteria bacterium]|nr:PLP-dependent aminotransferase family protein [Alphaproteobacteria bacterium]
MTGPRYLALVEAITAAIAGGRLSPGDRLPPQRTLAYDLGLSVNTVMRAYVEAERRGLVAGEIGRGTFVRGRALPGLVPQPIRAGAAAEAIDLRINLAAQDDAARLLPEALAAIAATDGDITLLLDAPGRVQLRHAEAGCRWIERTGLAARPEGLHLTVGAQHGILVGLMAVCRPGDAILVEKWTYPLMKQLAERLSLHLHALAMDADGIVPESLEEACRRTRAKLLYCMPTIHCATAATMPEERRRRVAEIVTAHAVTVIEDDVFGQLPAQRPLPLAAFAPEQCILVTSLSKTVASWLRLGFLVAPKRLAEPIRSAIHMSCWWVSPVLAEIGARWIADGTAERLCAGQRAVAEARQRMARACLGEAGVRATPDAFHLWLELPPSWRADTFCLEASRRGVEVLPGEVFACAPGGAEAVRLSLGGVREPERLRAGLEALADMLRAGPTGPGAVI